MKRGPAPIVLWAVMIIGSRSKWINHATVAYSRRDAVKAYMDMWVPEYQLRVARERGKTWRPVKVAVELLTSWELRG